MTKIRHIENQLTILYNIINDNIVYKISYCGFKDQFSRKKGVQIAGKKALKSIELNYQPDRSNNKIIALILLNEVINHNQPRDFANGMIYVAGRIGFDV